jgi:hypothetical protein
MTTARSTHRALTARKAQGLKALGLLAEIANLFRNLTRALLDPYRPELHYMRGPGPKWHAKHAPAPVALGGMSVQALVPVRIRR